jgi:PKD repeat protein
MKTIYKISIIGILLAITSLTAGTAAAGTKPVADFTYTVNDGIYNTSVFNVQFTDTSIGEPTQWFWNFGDDTYSTVQNPTHEYISVGDYTVTLNVRNSWGISRTAEILHLV